MKAGDNLRTKLADVDWQKNGRTLILAISTQCHFCTDSAPFFRTLVAQAGKNVRIVAVLPQPVAESQQYLSSEGVHVDEIKQAAMDKLGVRGTPTMLLANSAGIVTNVWVGELQPQHQSQVFTLLAAAPAPLTTLPR